MYHSHLLQSIYTCNVVAIIPLLHKTLHLGAHFTKKTTKYILKLGCRNWIDAVF